MIDELPTPGDEPGWENLQRVETHRTNVFLWRKERKYEIRLRKKYRMKKGLRERALFFADWELQGLIETLQLMKAEIDRRKGRPVTEG